MSYLAIPCGSSLALIGANEEVLISIIIANIVKLYSEWFHLDKCHDAILMV